MANKLVYLLLQPGHIKPDNFFLHLFFSELLITALFFFFWIEVGQVCMLKHAPQLGLV